MNRQTNERHLSDDQLLAACLAGPAVGSDVDSLTARHLSTCTACAQRRTDLSGWVGDLSVAAIEEADAAFSGDRLARQQARILQRIDAEGRPGRVIAFPSGQDRPQLLRTKPTTRWVAAAAAAAFVVGAVAGHVVHDFDGGAARALRAPMQRLAVGDAAVGTTLRATAGAVSDDEFLGQIEAAVDSAGPAVLAPLDALTPRTWEER